MRLAPCADPPKASDGNIRRLIASPVNTNRPRQPTLSTIGQLNFLPDRLAARLAIPPETLEYPNARKELAFEEEIVNRCKFEKSSISIEKKKRMDDQFRQFRGCFEIYGEGKEEEKTIPSPKRLMFFFGRKIDDSSGGGRRGSKYPLNEYVNTRSGVGKFAETCWKSYFRAQSSVPQRNMDAPGYRPEPFNRGVAPFVSLQLFATHLPSAIALRLPSSVANANYFTRYRFHCRPWTISKMIVVSKRKKRKIKRCLSMVVDTIVGSREREKKKKSRIDDWRGMNFLEGGWRARPARLKGTGIYWADRILLAQYRVTFICQQ